MHELGIASSVLEAVQTETQRHPGARVSKIGLRIGELAGVDAEALSFCFAVLVRDTPWQPVALEIESVPQRRACRICRHEFVVANHRPECPICGSPESAFLAGDELEIVYLEMETS